MTFTHSFEGTEDPDHYGLYGTVLLSPHFADKITEAYERYRRLPGGLRGTVEADALTHHVITHRAKYTRVTWAMRLPDPLLARRVFVSFRVRDFRHYDSIDLEINGRGRVRLRTRRPRPGDHMDTLLLPRAEIPAAYIRPGENAFAVTTSETPGLRSLFFAGRPKLRCFELRLYRAH